MIMLKKLAFLLLLLPFLLLTVVISPVFAKDSDNFANIPEKNGDYLDLDHPGVRVRVFVHEPKNSAPLTAVCSDLDSGSVDALTGWHLPSNVTYRLNTSSAPVSVNSNFRTIASNAFGTWQTAVGSNKVVFTPGSDTTTDRQALDYQNIVAFGRTSGNALAVTYTRYYTATHEVADVDTIFNKKFAWNWTDPASSTCSLYLNSYDAQDILTHELGHWMGLKDHYTTEYENNTMFGYGSKAEIKKDTLTTGDITGVNNIYLHLTSL